MSETPKETRSGSERRVRDYVIKFRAKEEERAEILANAAATGYSVGSFLRSLAITRPRTRAVRRPLADAALLTQVLGQLGRIGGNVHQLVKLANRGEIPWPEELEAAGKKLDAAAEAVEKALRG